MGFLCFALHPLLRNRRLRLRRRLTPLILHHSSYSTHLTPLILHHSSYSTHLTPLILHHSSYTTHLAPNILLSTHGDRPQTILSGIKTPRIASVYWPHLVRPKLPVPLKTSARGPLGTLDSNTAPASNQNKLSTKASSKLSFPHPARKMHPRRCKGHDVHRPRLSHPLFGVNLQRSNELHFKGSNMGVHLHEFLENAVFQTATSLRHEEPATDCNSKLRCHKSRTLWKTHRRLPFVAL